MYCVKCGVLLADSEQKCPLCGTAVCHPEFPRAEVPGPYPQNDPPREEFNRAGTLFILTFVFAIPLLLTLVCDLSLTGSITWSGYAAGSIAFAYTVIVLPLWFRTPEPVAFVSADFVVAALFLFYVNESTGADWFLPFALPVLCLALLITDAVVALCHYLGRGYLFIIGGGLMAAGGFSVFVEGLLNRTFALRQSLIWSFYPLVSFVLIGAMLLVIALSPHLRESLKKKFFL